MGRKLGLEAVVDTQEAENVSVRAGAIALELVVNNDMDFIASEDVDIALELGAESNQLAAERGVAGAHIVLR